MQFRKKLIQVHNIALIFKFIGIEFHTDEFNIKL